MDASPAGAVENQSALHLLSQAWTWRELNGARCHALLEAAGGPRPGEASPTTSFTLPESTSQADPVPRAELSGPPELVAARLVVWGYLCFREARQAEALECASEALERLSGSRQTFWYTRALNVRSCAQLELGEFELATLSLREALRACRDNGDAETEGSVLHDLGVMHTRRDPGHAEGYLLAAKAVFERLNHPVGRSFVSWSLGELSERHGDLPQATRFYLGALDLARDCGHLFLEVLVLSRLGELELQHGDPHVGEAWLRSALARQSDDPSRPLWITVPPLVRLLIHTARLPEARTLLEAQLAGMKAAGMSASLSSVHELLSEVLEALGEYVLALHHVREHLRLFRQENAQEQAQKVRGLEVLHRTELAQQEALTLGRRNTELQSALAELERLHCQLEQASVTDELTGVHNRHHLMTEGVRLLRAQAEASHSAHRHPAHAAVAILDIDHFKRVNDTYGHDGGDRVLRAFAQLLRSGLREHDLLARFGGEEFVILFLGTPLGEAYGLLDGLRLSLQAQLFEELPGLLKVSFTAGVVNCLDGDLLGALHRADQLLYRGKRSGRNAVTRETP